MLTVQKNKNHSTANKVTSITTPDSGKKKKKTSPTSKAMHQVADSSLRKALMRCVNASGVDRLMRTCYSTVLHHDTRTFSMLKCRCRQFLFISLILFFFFLPCYIILQYLWLLDCLSTSSRRLSGLFESLEDSSSTFSGEIGLLEPTLTNNLSLIQYSI